MTAYLTLEDLLSLTADLGNLVLRDIGLLQSAAERPSTTLYGREAYPDPVDKAAVLLESPTRNHALVDGNKRLGWLSATVFPGLNGTDLDAPDDDSYDLVIAVATGELIWEESVVSLREWCRVG